MSSRNDSRRIKILEEMPKVIYREWSLKGIAVSSFLPFYLINMFLSSSPSQLCGFKHSEEPSAECPRFPTRTSGRFNPDYNGLRFTYFAFFPIGMPR